MAKRNPIRERSSRSSDFGNKPPNPYKKGGSGRRPWAMNDDPSPEEIVYFTLINFIESDDPQEIQDLAGEIIYDLQNNDMIK